MFATSMVFGRFASPNEEERGVRIAGNPGIRTCHSSSVRSKSPSHSLTARISPGRVVGYAEIGGQAGKCELIVAASVVPAIFVPAIAL
jgi:hypothetical protein